MADGFSDDLAFGPQLIQNQSFALAGQHEFASEALQDNDIQPNSLETTLNYLK